MRIVTILGIPFNAITVSEALNILVSYLDEPNNHIIVTPNPEGVMQARRNPAFAQALIDADLRLADGTGIVMASRWIGDPMPGRVRGIDTVLDLFGLLSKTSRNVTAYFLGAAPGVAEAAKTTIESKYAHINVTGYHHGYFDSAEEDIILEEINHLKPDILLVCTGMPQAELWAQKYRDLPVRITLCVGGTLDIFGQKVKLAPAPFRKLGLEWLYRLIRQPSRAKRMLDIPRFVLAVLREGRK